jgi:hypothetical protein
MRTRSLVLGLGALLAACAAGCSSDAGEAPFDAGDLSDVVLTGHDGGASHDGAAPADASPADATTGGDSSLPSGDDSGAVDASEGGAPSEAGVDAAHDTGAADTGVDSSGGGDAASDANGNADGGVDSSGDTDAGGDDGGDGGTGDDSSVDASGDDAAGDDAGGDAGGDAAACVACGSPLSFLGNTAAFENGQKISLTGGTVPSGAAVSAITQTYPKGAALSVHLVYATDSAFKTQVDVVMNKDADQGNNNQWYFVIPAQASGTTVYWYVYADSCDCKTTLYAPGNFQNFTYAQQ